MFGLIIILGILTGLLTTFLIKHYFFNDKEENLSDKQDEIARKYLEIGNYSTLDYIKGTTEWLDKIIADGIKSGIKSIDVSDSHYINIEFNNDVKGKLWDSNKYYGWLCRGEITMIDKNSNEVITNEFDNVQPTAYAMYRLRLAIDEFGYDDLPNVKVSRIKNKK